MLLEDDSIMHALLVSPMVAVRPSSRMVTLPVLTATPVKADPTMPFSVAYTSAKAQLYGPACTFNYHLKVLIEEKASMPSLVYA